MRRIFVDTNIIIDLLQKREDFYQEAQELFTFADQKKVEIFISSLSITTANYLLSKHYSSSQARKIKLALASDFKDFEDAIQYHTALEHQIEIIITRNKRDFQKTSIPVMTAKELVRNLN